MIKADFVVGVMSIFTSIVIITYISVAKFKYVWKRKIWKK